MKNKTKQNNFTNKNAYEKQNKTKQFYKQKHI